MTVLPILCADLTQEIEKIGCDERSIPIFLEKAALMPIKVFGVKPSLGNILKQEMLTCKGDAVLHRHSVSCQVENTDVLLLGTRRIYREFIRKIYIQNYPTLTRIAQELESLFQRLQNPAISIPMAHGKKMDVQDVRIMGILNITEDSFYDGGRYSSVESALKRAEEMIEEGADIIDIGGESTRPGAQAVLEDEELNRVIPIVEALSKRLDILISVDTYKSTVAKRAVEAGAHIINDISGLGFDTAMAGVVVETGAALVMMHIKGTPKDMQREPFYEDVVVEIARYFEERLSIALSAGIDKERIILDPGIGFGKRLSDNIEIIRNLGAFGAFGLPILVGASRKSMIGALLGEEGIGAVSVHERLFGTLAVHSIAVQNSAKILRVHDVKAHRDMIKVLSKLK